MEHLHGDAQIEGVDWLPFSSVAFLSSFFLDPHTVGAWLEKSSIEMKAGYAQIEQWLASSFVDSYGQADYGNK